MGKSECAFYSDTCTNGHMISVHRWNRLYAQFHSEIFSAKLKEFIGRQTDHRWWDLGSPGGFMGQIWRPCFSSTEDGISTGRPLKSWGNEIDRFELSHGCEIWQVPWKQCCRGAHHIAERLDKSKHKSCSFETSRSSIFALSTGRPLDNVWQNTVWPGKCSFISCLKPFYCSEKALIDFKTVVFFRKS